MAEPVIHRNEEQYPWESDEWDDGTPTGLRVRTLVSGARIGSNGISMGTCELPPGAELAPHHHEPPEVYYVTAGAAEVFYDGAWRPLSRGDVIFLPANVVHGARNLGDSTCSIVWMFPVDAYEDIEYFADPHDPD
jgi:quercetin dioxygenase-like cupin family protein